jgi:hypothetical protein
MSQPASGAAFNEVAPGLAGIVAAVIRDGQSSGEFAASVPPDVAGLALVAAWNAIAIGWAKTGDTKQATQGHRQVLDLFLLGLLRRIPA